MDDLAAALRDELCHRSLWQRQKSGLWEAHFIFSSLKSTNWFFPLATAKKVPSRRFGLEIEQDASH